MSTGWRSTLPGIWLPDASVTATELMVPFSTVMSIGSFGHIVSRPCAVLMVMAVAPSPLVAGSPFWPDEPPAAGVPPSVRVGTADEGQARSTQQSTPPGQLKSGERRH